jgi:hypothetical protein
MIPRSPIGGYLLGLTLLALAAPADAQVRLERVRTLGGGDLFNVRDAAFQDAELIVLTSPAPALHRFGEQYRAWGRAGDGPAELRNPREIAVAGDRVLVRDGRLAKIVSFDRGGAAVATRPLGSLMVNRFELAGRDTLVGLFEPIGVERVVARLRGARTDTIIRYRVTAPQVKLEGGGPSLTLAAPFHPVPVWAGLTDGTVAFWDAASPRITLHRREGGAPASLPLPERRYPVTAADREVWFEEEIPQEFMGQRIFEGARERARETVRFPPRLPAVLRMVSDPAGGVWILQTTAGSGEVWTRLDAGSRSQTVRFPPGWRVLAFGMSEIAVLVRDELEEERVEVFRRPR